MELRTKIIFLYKIHRKQNKKYHFNTMGFRNKHVALCPKCLIVFNIRLVNCLDAVMSYDLTVCNSNKNINY